MNENAKIRQSILKQNQWNELKNKHGDHAYSKLLYKIHFENGGTSAWSHPKNNNFVEEHLNNLEWYFSGE